MNFSKLLPLYTSDTIIFLLLYSVERAPVAELADAGFSKSSAERHTGSTPVGRTTQRTPIDHAKGGLSALRFFISAGNACVVQASRILCVLSPSSAPIKRMYAEHKRAGTLVDATSGRPTRSLLLLDCGTLIASPISIQTIRSRVDGPDTDSFDLHDDDLSMPETEGGAS